MLRLEKEATPATAATVAVPESAPPPGFVPIATVTLPVKPVVGLPSRSRAVTRTAGVIGDPATVLVGCVVNASRVVLPGFAVAVKLTGDPASPATVAVAVWAPGVLPSARVAWAWPVAPVTEEGVIVPPPPVTA